MSGPDLASCGLLRPSPHLHDQRETSGPAWPTAGCSQVTPNLNVSAVAKVREAPSASCFGLEAVIRANGGRTDTRASECFARRAFTTIAVYRSALVIELGSPLCRAAIDATSRLYRLFYRLVSSFIRIISALLPEFYPGWKLNDPPLRYLEIISIETNDKSVPPKLRRV